MLTTEGLATADRALPPADLVRSSKGLTLLELIIALLVLQIALVTFAQFITRALDYSRRIRQVEMAQILAQARMEELIRTFTPADALAPGTGEGDSPSLLNERPGTFEDMAYGLSEDIDPFKWIAEVNTSERNPKLLELTLHIYVVDRRTKSEKTSEPVEDFYLSEDRERFMYTYTLPDNSVEVMLGRQKLEVTSAVAIP